MKTKYRLVEFKGNTGDNTTQIGLLHDFGAGPLSTFAIIEDRSGRISEVNIALVRFVDTICPTDGTVWVRRSPAIELKEYELYQSLFRSLRELGDLTNVVVQKDTATFISFLLEQIEKLRGSNGIQRTDG